MSLDLLNELEKRVQSAVDTIETMKLEIEQLKEDNAQLQDEKAAWQSRLGDLLGKFDLLDSSEEETAASDEGSLQPQESAEEALIEELSSEDDEDTLLEELSEEDEDALLEEQTAPSQFS
jgi:FtsZ-binding cell division protein ZapB